MADSSSHDTAPSGSQRQSGAYLRGRPSCPSASVEWITSRLVRGVGPVADVGAGTGALSVLLADQVGAVAAIEPVKAMIDKCASHIARAQSAAGRLPFQDQALGGITVATAFHRFATTEVLDESHRCQAEDGSLILVWSDRDDRVPWVAEHNALVDLYAEDTPHFVIDGLAEGRRRASRVRRGRLRGVPEPYPHDARGAGRADRLHLLIAPLPEQEFQRVQRKAEALATSLPESFEYPYVTRIWCY